MKRFCRMRSRNPVARFVFAAVAVCLLVIPSRANATPLIWDWSFAGTEAGTFTTNGTVADTASSFNFTITNFTVTSSTITSLIGSGYTENQPLQGFLWDGTEPTQFYRSSGSFTNGSNFYVSSPAYIYGFYTSSGTAFGGLEDPNESPAVSAAALTLTVAPVPEPTTYAMALAGLACGGYAVFRRRRIR